MSDPLGLTGEAASVAAEIRAIDLTLDELKERARASVISGLHSSGFALGANLQQQAADNKHRQLLEERAQLVSQLRTLVADGDVIEGPRSSTTADG